MKTAINALEKCRVEGLNELFETFRYTVTGGSVNTFMERAMIMGADRLFIETGIEQKDVAYNNTRLELDTDPEFMALRAEWQGKTPTNKTA